MPETKPSSRDRTRFAKLARLAVGGQEVGVEQVRDPPQRHMRPGVRRNQQRVLGAGEGQETIGRLRGHRPGEQFL